MEHSEKAILDANTIIQQYKIEKDSMEKELEKLQKKSINDKDYKKKFKDSEK